MITEKEAAKQLARMAGMNFFPRGDGPEDRAALLELRNAMQTADTPEIAKSVTDDWLGMRTERPTPADLRAMIFERNAPKVIADPQCATCGGTGFEPVQRGDYSGVKDCSCRVPRKAPATPERGESGMHRVGGD